MTMTLPSFRINQPGGGGTGTLDTARPYGLREGVAVNLVTTETGPYLWEIVAAPPGSSATISNSTSATATITPDVNNLPWRIRLTTGTGISAKTRVFVMGADLDASGVEVGDGFMPPAYGEREGEDNSDSRGYAARVEYIIDTLRAGGGGGGGTLAGDATGPAGSNTVEAVQNIPIDFFDSPDPGTALVVEDTGLGPRIRARQRHISRVYYDEGNLTAQVPVYNSFDDAFAAAAALLIIANGPVELVVLNDNDPPVFPASTFDGFGLIDIVGSPAVRGQRIEVNVEDGFLLRNPRSLRNLYIEHDTSTPWLETTGGADLNLVLDNTRLYVNGVSTDICTLAASTTGNRLQLINGSSIEGDTGKFATLIAGKTITAYIDSGTINGEIFGGSAGIVVIFQGPDGSVEPQASFSGGISYTSAVVTALSQAPTNVAFNDKRLTTIASPTSGTDATNQNWVDGAQSVSVAGSGSVSLNAANISRGSLQLTGALTGDRTVTLPSGTRSLWIRNGTTGLYTLRLEGPSGGFCYLLPGQDRRVYVDGSGILRGEALYLCETEITVNCVGVNNTTIPLLGLPAGFVLERVERYLVTAFATGDGDYTDSVGATSTDDILVESGGITAGAVYGLDNSQWGTNFSESRYLFTSADTLDYRFNEFNETVALTAGAVCVRIAGRYFGSGGAPPPWTPANLSPGVLVGWDGRTAADLTLVSGKISAWRDRASGNHLVQATDSNRPLAGFSALGRGIAVWGNGSSARLITSSDIAAVKYAYVVATFFAPPSTRSTGDELAAFNGAYQSYLTIRGVANPSHGAIVGDIGTDDLYAAAPLDGSFYIDGVLTSPPSVGRQGRRRVVEVHFTTARPVGPLGALVYGTDGTPLPAEGALHEIVLLSASASADDRANVRSYLTSYHLAAPVVACSVDSLSACVNISTRQSWPWLLHRERYGGTVSVVNLGVPGQLVTTATSGDPAKLASVKGLGKNVLVLLGGANDVLDGASAATVWTRLQAYITDAVAAGWEVVLCSVPNATAETGGYSAGMLTVLSDLRDLIAAGWSAAGAARYVDLYALSLTRQADGIHFTSADCQIVADEIGPKVDLLLEA